MPISFQCDSCGANYVVEARLAGRKGRCKKCGATMNIPIPATVGAGAAAGGGFRLSQGDDLAAQSANVRRQAVGQDVGIPTNIGLAPLDKEDVDPNAAAARNVNKFNPALLEKTQAGLYKLIPTDVALPRQSLQKGDGKRPSNLRMYWRQLITGQLKVVRKISELIYLLSVPFIMMLLLGVLLRKEHLAYTGAVVVVLLNIGRFVLNFIYLISVPLREGPMTGLLFLFPPYTIYYLLTHWSKMRKAFLSFLGPALPIAVVAALFAFVPWLRSGGKDDAIERMRESAEAKAGQVRDAIESPEGGSLGERARQGLQQIGNAARLQQELSQPGAQP